MTMFAQKYLASALAIAGLALTAYTVFSSDKGMPPSLPIPKPAHSPFRNVVAGAGLVEASSQNINVGSDIAAIATHVYVKVGDRVQAGDPLFSLDTRQVQADPTLREAQLH